MNSNTKPLEENMFKSFSKVAATAGAVALLATPAFAATRAADPASAPADNTLTLPALTVSITPNYAIRRERHPEIRKAIAALEGAKRALQDGAHDFGGHRLDALAACDNAINQLRIALQYDR